MLGKHPEMTDHIYSIAHKQGDLIGEGTFQFHGISSSFYETPCTGKCLIRSLISMVWKICCHRSMFNTSTDSLQMMDDFVQGNIDGVFLTKNDHAQRISHKD